jgi:hypothetical protein
MRGIPVGAARRGFVWHGGAVRIVRVRPSESSSHTMCTGTHRHLLQRPTRHTSPPCPEARGGCTSTRLSHTPHEKLGKRNALSWIRTCLGWHVLRKIVDLKDHAWRCGAAATHHRRGQPQRRIAVSCRLTLLLQLRRRRQSRKVMPARNAPPATLHMSSFGSSVLRYNACFTLALPMRRRHHSDTSTFHVRARLCIWGANLCVPRTSQSISAHHQEANIIQK